MANLKVISESVVVKVQESYGGLLPSDKLNEDIIFAPDDVALRRRAEATKGRGDGVELGDGKSYSLEFINIWYDYPTLSWERNRTVLARHGLQSEFVDSNTKTEIRSHKCVPVDIPFSVTLWTKRKEVADRFIEENCFLQFGRPELEFYYEDNKKLEIDFLVRPLIKAEDTVAKMFVEGKYYKPSVVWNVEGWFIKNFTIKALKEVNIEMYSIPSDGELLRDEENKIYETTIDENT